MAGVASTQSLISDTFATYYDSPEWRATTPPQHLPRREFGHIPQSAPDTMRRHQGITDADAFYAYPQSQSAPPLHWYYSAAHYLTPSFEEMHDKERTRTDLIFDLDYDHLPTVTPEMSHADALEACKDATRHLIGILQMDIGIDTVDMSVVFSGNGGYHVHVDSDADEWATLDSEARAALVDYLTGELYGDADTTAATDWLESHTETDVIQPTGHGRTTAAHSESLDLTGGRGKRVSDILTKIVRTACAAVSDSGLDADALTSETAAEQLDLPAAYLQYDGIGEQTAADATRAIARQPDAVRAGEIDIHPAVKRLVMTILEKYLTTSDFVAVDAPVTKDLRRLIRVPGSLHGGTGLRVTRVSIGDLDSFDPFTDAVPEAFTAADAVSVTVNEDGAGPLPVAGGPAHVDAETQTLPMQCALYLLLQDRATPADSA